MVPDHTDGGQREDSAVWYTLKKQKRGRIDKTFLSDYDAESNLSFKFLLNIATDCSWKHWLTIVLQSIFTARDTAQFL